MPKCALQDELDQFFKVLQGGEVADHQVTDSAFTQARQKLKYIACTHSTKSVV